MNLDPNAETISKIARRDPLMMNILCRVRELGLPDCWIGAGFVRNKVWDVLSGRGEITRFEDIDVIYFNLAEVTQERDREIERSLAISDPAQKWSVKNQARMNLRNGDSPYRSSEHAIAHWPETATSVAVSIDQQNRIKVIAPHGLDDLFSFVVRPTPAFAFKVDLFEKRQLEKNWKQKWPNLQVCKAASLTHQF